MCWAEGRGQGGIRACPRRHFVGHLCRKWRNSTKFPTKQLKALVLDNCNQTPSLREGLQRPKLFSMSLLSGKKWFTWPRLVCLVVTLLILFFIFHKIGSPAFIAALKQTRLSWFLLGFLAYGIAIWVGSLRWHLALRLTDRAIHLSASSRLFFIGHFFYVVLFGAAGGDLAKSAVYARYYRFGIPEVVAAAPLDRVFGFGGNIL